MGLVGNTLSFLVMNKPNNRKMSTVFVLSIIRQVRLPSVQIHVRTVEEVEQLEGKTYRELTMSQHLPNAKKIYRNATDQTRTMAAFMYFVLYEQITSLKASQTGCSRRFPVPRNPVQEASNWEETTWWPRKIRRTEKQEDAGRGS